MNNYIKILSFNSKYITGQVYGTIKKDDLVELYDTLKNPLGIYSHIESISLFGLDYETLEHGCSADFTCPGLDESILDVGMRLVVD